MPKFSNSGENNTITYIKNLTNCTVHIHGRAHITVTDHDSEQMRQLIRAKIREIGRSEYWLQEMYFEAHGERIAHIDFAEPEALRKLAEFASSFSIKT
ncbi:hypothetical protein [Geovibrio ferrireducens]|uniref:hypothetical protein n=1 Tax=Geovibrio ferrireducens TaxID=46201 RepID=UPI0022451DC5|nr:hypothetical protein [Geovibrio ferrireducens]